MGFELWHAGKPSLERNITLFYVNLARHICYGFLYMIRVHFYLILHVIKLNTYMKGFDYIYYALTYTIFYK